MLWSKKQSFFSAVIFSLLAAVTARSQTVEQTFQFANQLYAHTGYKECIKYYERVLFFGNSDFNTACYERMGNCYSYLNNIEQANEYYEFAYFSSEDDSIKNEMLFKRSFNFLMEKKFKLAMQELLSLSDNQSVSFQKRKNLYFAIAYFGDGQYTESEKYFDLLIPDSDSASLQNLDYLFLKNEKLNRRNPKVAKVLSIIIPGAGQLYAGDVKNGINSLLLTGGFALLFINTAFTYSFMDAFTAVGPWYYRYYYGGFKRAEAITVDRVEIKRAKIFSKIMDSVQPYAE